MTPLPKRRHSKSRSRIRRASLHTDLPQMVLCSHCGVRILPHRVCPACGFYGGKEVVVHKEAIKLATKSTTEKAG